MPKRTTAQTRRELSARGRYNRRKGKDGQREFLRAFIHMLTGLSWDHPDQTIRYSSTQHHPDGFLDGSPVDSWHIETKKCNRWELRAWIREAERDAGPDRSWFIAARLAGALWRVIKPEDDAERWFIVLPGHMLDQFWTYEPRWYQGVESGKLWSIRDAIQRQDQNPGQCVKMHKDGRVVRLWAVLLEPESQEHLDPKSQLRWGHYYLLPAQTWAYLVSRSKEWTDGDSGGAPRDTAAEE